MSSGTHTTIDGVLQSAVASGAVPNVVGIAADRDGVIYEAAFGPRVAGQAGDVTVDTRFRIMSMTKTVVTVVALQLLEQHKLDLDAPVEEYVPEFAEVQVLERLEGDRPVLRAPAGKATIGQLITHTTGLGYWFWSSGIRAWHEATGTPNVLSGSMAIFNAPMTADPGTRFVYGINGDWLGRVVEAVSGTSLPEAVADRVTGPLGMRATAFTLPDQQRGEATPVHRMGEDGHWAASHIDLPAEPEWWAGGHGLYSTPRDFLKFQRMLLGDGTSPDGVTILSPETVDAAFCNQIGELDFPADIPTADPASSLGLHVGPGYKWGYGLLLNTHDEPGRRRAFTGAWAGLYNTHFWVDRTTGVTGAIYSNSLPFITDEALKLYADYETALYAAL